MPYLLPQVRVFQDFTVVPTFADNPLRAHISGGHAWLVRYSEEDERQFGRLGYYDTFDDAEFTWPNLPFGANVDQSYAKLWIKDALLRYFQDSIGGDSVITKVNGYNNRVHSASVNFASNGSVYPRDDVLLERDVRPGDVAQVRGISTVNGSVTLWTYVKSLIGDPVASTINAVEFDANNAAPQGSPSSSVDFVSGVENCIELTPDHTDYDGLADGDVTETYDIIVLEGSVSGDFTTAKLRIISGSGHDDVGSIRPEPDGDPTPIGNRGLTVAFGVNPATACSDVAEAAHVSANDLIPGQRWQVSVSQAFTPVTAASAGTYTDKDNTTYIVSVFRGGLFGDDPSPQIMVTTNNGIDISGPTSVSAAATPIAVGTQGVTIAFTGTGLRKGDKYYIEVEGEAVGALRTVELGHNLDNDIPPGSEVDLTLFIRNPLLQVHKPRIGFAPLVNWETTETGITVNSGIIAYDPSWTDGLEPQPLDVISEESQGYGEMFIEYRAWQQLLCHEINGIQDPGELDVLIPGPLTPDNPLKWGVFKALSNANGSQVMYSAVCNPDDVDSWSDVLALLLGRDDIYNLVPLTRTKEVLDLYQAHCEAQSAPEQAMWRVCWINLAGVPEIPVVAAGSDVSGHSVPTTTDGQVALAVIEDDQLVAGTQYTRVRFTSGNAALLTNGVRTGDIVRTLYTGDGFGGVTYSEFVVATVRSNDELVVAAGPAGPVSMPAKTEVWRNLTATEEAQQLGLMAGSFGDRRVRAIWPDIVGSGGTAMEGFYLCAALAGLASGILPQQGMTHLEIQGFDDLTRTTRKFTRTQLDSMAEGGVWIVTRDPVEGTVFTRHAVTTGDSDDINQREEMVTRNVDSISFRFQDGLSPFIGVSNVTPATEIAIRQEISKIIDALRSEAASPRTTVGTQLIDGIIVSFGPHTVFKDRYVLVLNAIIPYPANNIDVHIVI